MRIAVVLAVATTFVVVGCSGGAKPPAGAAPEPDQEAARSAPPVAGGDHVPPPVGDDQRVAFCIGGFERGPNGDERSECASRRTERWHLHGYVVARDGLCYQCWDEEDSDCESAAPNEGYRYLGAHDCESAQPAEPGAGPMTEVVR